MSPLGLERCRNHVGREAVARCPDCRGYFCRECVTEHEDGLRCARCLGKAAADREPDAAGRTARQALRGLGALGAAALGLLIAWLCIYSLGRVLLAIPSEVHDGSLWEEPAAVELDP